MSESNKNVKKVGATPGLAIIGCQVTGLVGLIGAVLALSKFDALGAGACLIGAACAFGTVAYISFSE